VLAAIVLAASIGYLAASHHADAAFTPNGVE
jgi:hypothetical protein